MAHEIETTDRLLLHKNPAWHGLGTIIDDELTAVEAGQRVGMFWPVEQWALTATNAQAADAWQAMQTAIAKGAIAEAQQALAAYQSNSLGFDSHVANVRLDNIDGHDIKSVLGVVGAEYQICQNRELAEFVDAMAQTGKVIIESCGSIRGGKRVWFLARGESFEIGGGDQVFPYVLASNGHDGGQTIRITPTSIRVVCSNTLHMVLGTDDGAHNGETAAISIRHTGSVSTKLDEARKALAEYQKTVERNHQLYELLNNRTISRKQTQEYFAQCYSMFWGTATAAETGAADDKVRTKAENRMYKMREACKLFMDRLEREENTLHMGGTLWAALNGFTGYVQHDVALGNGDREMLWRKRAERNLFGTAAQQSVAALQLALALAS